eukprot:228599-Rhodomonas_salina.2
MSGTDIAYAGPRSLDQLPRKLAATGMLGAMQCGVLWGTVLGWGHAMCGTEPGYAAIRALAHLQQPPMRPQVDPSPTHCPVLLPEAEAFPVKLITAGIVLRVRYAKSGTSKGYAAIVLGSCYKSGTDIAYAATAVVLRVRYSMSGTDLGYGATRTSPCTSLRYRTAMRYQPTRLLRDARY